jgi:hypothetical protein
MILKESTEPFRVMQSDSSTSIQRTAQINPSDASVDTSIMAFAMDPDHNAKGKEKSLSSNNNDKLPSPDALMQSSSVENSDQSRDQQHAEAVEQIDLFSPASHSEMSSRANKVIDDLGRYQNYRIHHPSLLLDDLQELGNGGRAIGG